MATNNKRKKQYLTVAAVQVSPTADCKKNSARAVEAIYEAHAKGAEYIVLPELFLYRGDLAGYAAVAEEVGGPITTLFSSVAKTLGVFLVLGTIIEKSRDAQRFYDTAICIGPDGLIRARYRKKNLFCVTLGKTTIDERAMFLPGKKISIHRAYGYAMGLAICFDVRFPELFQKMRSAGVACFSVPSNFTHTTGEAHWEVLVRARAIETQSCLIAANCCGVDQATKVKSYGNSMIVDAWGNILARAGEKETVLVVPLDLSKVDTVRATMPLRDMSE